MTRWQELDAYLDAHGVPHGPPRPSQTTSGTHAVGSYHYNPPATARDYGDADGPLERIWQTFAPLAQGEHAPLVELFGPWGLWKNGQRIYNTLLQKQHNDHVHAAIHPDRSLPTQQPEDTLTPELAKRLDELEAKVNEAVLHAAAADQHHAEVLGAFKNYTNELKKFTTDLRDTIAEEIRRLAVAEGHPVRKQPDGDPAV